MINVNELLKRLSEQLRGFLVRNLGSSICVRSRIHGLVETALPSLLREITKDYLVLTNIGIDDVRTITDFLFTSSLDQIKIVAIFQAENILHEAANALLKTLEEPPSKSVVLLATTRYYDLLPTIRSRLKVFDLCVPEEYYAKLFEKIQRNDRPEYLFRLAQNDFTVFKYLLENEFFVENKTFEVNEFLRLFESEKLEAKQRIDLLYMIDDLMNKLVNNREDYLLQLYSQIVTRFEHIDPVNLIYECCRSIQVILEAKQINDTQYAKFLDSILSNKLKNFNTALTLINILILTKKVMRR